jgi:hypothetical protein
VEREIGGERERETLLNCQVQMVDTYKTVCVCHHFIVLRFSRSLLSFLIFFFFLIKKGIDSSVPASSLSVIGFTICPLVLPFANFAAPLIPFGNSAR